MSPGMCPMRPPTFDYYDSLSIDSIILFLFALGIMLQTGKMGK